MANVSVDTEGLKELAELIGQAKRLMLGRIAERGYQLLRAEVPKVTTNLQQGVAPPDVDYRKLEATLTVSARSARVGATKATLHLKSGETRQVNLRAQPEYNYAEVVARGNKKAVLYPKKAKAFLIPVGTAPTDESYVSIDGKNYVMRRSRKGRKGNPYDERAAQRLENELEPIGTNVLREIFV